MHGRFAIIGGRVPGCPPKIYAYVHEDRWIWLMNGALPPHGPRHSDVRIEEYVIDNKYVILQRLIPGFSNL